MMWIFAEHHGIPASRGAGGASRPIRYSKPLEPRKFDRDVHDLGFIFMSTYYRWYELDAGRRAGRSRDARRDVRWRCASTRKADYLRSFVSADSLFIDIMMNVGIIFYAALERAMTACWTVAHARTASPRAACWCAATVPPRTKASSTWKPASS